MQDSSGAAEAGAEKSNTAAGAAPGAGEHYVHNAQMIRSMPVIPGATAEQQGAHSLTQWLVARSLPLQDHATATHLWLNHCMRHFVGHAEDVGEEDANAAKASNSREEGAGSRDGAAVLQRAEASAPVAEPGEDQHVDGREGAAATKAASKGKAAAAPANWGTITDGAAPAGASMIKQAPAAVDAVMAMQAAADSEEDSSEEEEEDEAGQETPLVGGGEEDAPDPAAESSKASKPATGMEQEESSEDEEEEDSEEKMLWRRQQRLPARQWQVQRRRLQRTAAVVRRKKRMMSKRMAQQRHLMGQQMP